MRQQIESTARTTAGIYKINPGDMRGFRLPVPPLLEQHRSVAEVERRLSVVEEMEKTIDANLTRAERLRQAILARAFAGKLVPQDPTDEPASVLLERIRAERGDNSTQKPGRKGRRVKEAQIGLWK
jgi:type I restriction enzyme S subunit